MSNFYEKYPNHPRIPSKRLTKSCSIFAAKYYWDLAKTCKNSVSCYIKNYYGITFHISYYLESPLCQVVELSTIGDKGLISIHKWENQTTVADLLLEEVFSNPEKFLQGKY